MKFMKHMEPMEETVEQEKPTKLLKHAKLYILGTLLAILLLSLILPKRCPIDIQTTAFVYAMDQQAPIAEHEVSIEGIYLRRLFREDVYQGSLEVSGYPETAGASAYIQFYNDHDFGMISYQQDGIPIWDSELKQIYTNLDFSVFVIQLFEVSKDGDDISASWDGADGRVLSTAPDYESLLEYCEVLKMKSAS